MSLCTQDRKTPCPIPGSGSSLLRGKNRQALGRLPWFAPFFLRARRFRPVLPIVCSFKLGDSVLSQSQAPTRESGMISRMQKGLSNTIEFVVTANDTAEVLRSGDLPVLGTPRLLAWMEAATCAAIADSLPFGQTSVGTRVAIEHRAASAVGAHVAALATVTHVDGRLLKFEVVATDSHTGVVLGHGEITRVVVDRERFLARVTG